MKREIKFRAWDNMLHRWITEWFCIESDGIGIYMDDFEYTIDYRIEIMQFTGLKDKNGKEIYEGDILLADERRIVTVSWHEHAGSWDTNFISDRYPNLISFNELKNAHWYFRTEVIGNIYENPELINKQ